MFNIYRKRQLSKFITDLNLYLTVCI